MYTTTILSKNLTRIFLIYGGFVYAIASIVNSFFVVMYIEQANRPEGPGLVFLKLFDSTFILAECVLLLLIFRIALRAFNRWKSGSANFAGDLGTLARRLIFLFLVNSLALIFSIVFKVDYGVSSRNIYERGGWLSHIMNFIEYHSRELSMISKFLTPQPIGVLSLFLGVFILSTLGRDKIS